MKKFKRALKRMYIAFIRSRCESAQFKIADMMKHNYPANTSLHTIVRDMKDRNRG